MTKTITQIKFEMEVVKLIKEVMDVSGEVAYRKFKEWTTKEEKGLVTKNEDGETVLEIKSNGDTYGNGGLVVKENKDKLQQISNEMEEFRKLVLDKLDNLDKKDITVDLNRYTWASLSESMVGGTLDKEYDTTRGSVTGGNIEFEKPTIINVSLNIENLRNAKDLVNKLSDELRTKGLW